MAFDMSTAKPLEQAKKGFDLSTAKPITTADDVPVLGAGQVATPAQQGNTFADVANEAMSAVNRGGINAIDILGWPIREPINAALRIADSDYQIPTLRSSLANTRATVEGGQMQDGLAKDVIRTAGEFALPSGLIGGGVRKVAQSVTPQMTAANANAVLPNIGRQLSQGSVKADIGYGAASGAGSATGQEIGGDTGALVGGLVAPLTAGGMYSIATGTPTKRAQELVEYARKNNLPLLTTDVVQPKTFAGKAAQAMGEKIPLAGTGGVRADQQNARIAQIKKISDKYGVPSDEEIFKSIVSKRDTFKAAAGERYRNTISQMGDTEIPITNTNSVIDREIDIASRAGKIKNEPLIAQLKKIKDDLNAAPQDLALIRANRTEFRERLKNDDTIGRETADRVIDGVYNAITKDMTAGVESKLGADAANKMRQADRLIYEEANAVRKTKLRNILSKGDVKPELVTDMLFSRNKSEVKELFSSLGSNGKANARAAIINKAVEASKESPEVFLNTMDKLKTQHGIFFKGEDRKQLVGLLKYLEATREASQAAVRTKTGQETLQYAVPASVLTAGDMMATGGKTVAGFATIGLMARAYESRAVRSLMMRLEGAEKGSAAFKNLTKQLELQLQKEATKSEEEKK